uniref:J domain-containing protein n=1 Tax=Bionectria ochroleuca TaxID=29856 RepID=A0A8H7NNQ7_BIOOC
MNSTQDYYADLDLPPDADVTDIKKQYRKLALKYHPDRNPGREQEVNSKFLVIQAAHDILTDPQKKAKYDATRTRSGAGRYASSSGVKGNPWSDVSQQYPVPPRRRNDHAPRTNPSRGAERWNTRFSAGVPRPRNRMPRTLKRRKTSQQHLNKCETTRPKLVIRATKEPAAHQGRHPQRRPGASLRGAVQRTRSGLARPERRDIIRVGRQMEMSPQ